MIIHPISCLHATARAEMAIGCYNEWKSKANNFHEVEWIFGIDADDDVNYEKIYQFILKNSHKHCSITTNFGYKTCNSALNACAMKSSGLRLMDVCDDVGCPIGWDSIVIDDIPYPSQDVFIRYGDGQNSELCPHPVISRGRYEKKQYFMHPDFNQFHGFSDEDATLRARKDGVMKEHLDVVFEHRHPAFGKGQWDAIYNRGKEEGAAAQKVLWMHHPEKAR